MPREEIDYSNTVFYKISCKDTDVTDLYVGHTTNFVQRKYAHKRSCNTESDSNYGLKVYKVIRENGGWDNWKMEIIGFNECNDHYEARKIEQKYFESLNANLNSVPPMPKRKIKSPVFSSDKVELYCKICNVNFESRKSLENHLNTQKHKNRTMNPKAEHKAHQCKVCNYQCNKKSDFEKHIATKKHKLALENNNKSSNLHKCDNCNKMYKYRSGLCKHRKKCNTKVQLKQVETNTMDNQQQLICSLIQRQNKLENQLREQSIRLKKLSEKIEK